MKDILLTAKTHPFHGAVLSPKHARDLTPSLCCAIASALSELYHQQSSVIPYTVWITEAWRVLGWAEPSAALFWEMATLYHTLHMAMDHRAQIPPILSCGSTSSMASSQTPSTIMSSKKYSSSSVSAKELPAWLVGTFLLIHCEESATQRNLSGSILEDRRFYAGSAADQQQSSLAEFNSMLQHNSRSRLTGWPTDHANHCIAYVLRHLRKFLLFCAIPHNREAVNACMHLAALPSASSAIQPRSIPDLRQAHMEEHGQVGLRVKLQLEDLERLHIILQPPNGGTMEEPLVPLGEYFWMKLFGGEEGLPPPPMATVPLADVEEQIRVKLEASLMEDSKGSTEDAASAASTAIASLSLGEAGQEDPVQEHEPDRNLKELTYSHLRGTTVIVKPDDWSGNASSASDAPGSSARLHDLNIVECSDTHLYLLQPFEHATINACSNCTIVIGAVAGLVHIVDCERCVFVTASRRVLVSSSLDVQLCVFTPSPPLLVGDNRTCQFAPYNTYYDGLREDLLAAGLAAAVIDPSSAPASAQDSASWPPLTCANNKWKQPVEIGKLEMPSVPTAASPSASAETERLNSESSTMHAPILVPAADFSVLFVPLVDEGVGYCRLLGDLLSSSPFRLPPEYERRVLVKADRMRRIQQGVKQLPEELQTKFQEELNRGFRDWLVSSGNLRQILDLVQLERRQGS